jgi:hypothetical protein
MRFVGGKSGSVAPDGWSTQTRLRTAQEVRSSPGPSKVRKNKIWLHENHHEDVFTLVIGKRGIEQGSVVVTLAGQERLFG